MMCEWESGKFGPRGVWASVVPVETFRSHTGTIVPNFVVILSKLQRTWEEEN